MATEKIMAEASTSEIGQTGAATATLKRPPSQDVGPPEDRFRDWFNRQMGEGESGAATPEVTEEETPAKQAAVPPGQEPPSGGGEGRGGGGDDGGPEEPGQPEGPRGPRPPEMGDKEWETSPERGRGIIREIYRLEAMDSYKARYQAKPDGLISLISETNQRIYEETNRPYLDQLYLDLQDYVGALRRTRKGGKEWDREAAYQLDFAPKTIEEIKEVVKKRREAMEARLNIIQRDEQGIDQSIDEWLKAELAQGDAEVGIIPEGRFEAETLPVESIDVLVSNLDTAKTQEEYDKAREGLSIYFRQAKRHGLLKEVDARLTSIYKDKETIKDRASIDDLENLVDRGIARALQRGGMEFREKSLGDPELARFENIEKVYIALAKRRFEKDLAGQVQEAYRTGEYILGLREQPRPKNPRETYWRTGSWPEYYMVDAKTPEEFRIATQTFLRMIKNRALGLSPEKLLPHFENFAKALGQAGSAPDVSASVTAEFMTELRQEFEGLSYIYGAWYTNESYNPEKYYQFMMALALHEGPQRMVALARSGDGQVAAFLKMLDDDPRSRAYYLSGGSRGQIGNDTVTQNVLQEEYMQMLIEEGMGIRLKDYDPYNAELNSDTPEAVQARRVRMIELGRIERELRIIEEEVRSGKERRQVSEDNQKIYDAFINNRAQIGVHLSEDRFRGLYEGFEYDKDKACNNANANIRNWEEFKGVDLNLLPDRLRRSVELGGVQVTLQGIRADIQNGKIKLKPGQKATDLLTQHEKGVYQAAYDEAKANLDIALQIVGALGEKVKKGGGVYFIDRNAYVKAYEQDWRNLEKKRFEELSKEQKIGRLLSHLRDGRVFKRIHLNDSRFYRELSEEDRQRVDMGLSAEEKRGAIDILLYRFYQILNEGDRRKFYDTLTTGERAELLEQVFYYGLTDEERADQVDNMPTDQAAGFIHCAENKIKILYANASAKDRKTAVDKVRDYAIQQIEQNGFDAILMLPKVEFDAEGNIIGTPGKLIFPKVQFDAEGNVVFDKDTEEVINFRDAVDSIWALHTSNTYWSYQQENRHMLTDPEVVAAAKRIRAGLSRPEDEDMLATQLLILDPTLKRVKRVPTNKQGREVIIFDAAVDESNFGHWRIERELARVFLPRDGDANNIRMGYNREDFGGVSRFIIAVKAYVAAHPKRFSRRFAAEIAEAPMHVTSYPDKVGQKGVLGLIEMHADEIGDIAGQKVASQFSITKFVNEMRYGWMMFGALFGYVDEEKGVSIEGLYEKPTNNSDKLAQYYEDLNKAENYIDSENKLFYELMETFGRLDRVLKLMRVMESDTNNAQGVLKTEGIEVFLSDGRFNREIAVEDSRNTGASRHSQREFFDAFVDWLQDDGPGGGALAYPSETKFYKQLENTYWYVDANGKRQTQKNSDGSLRTWRDWLFDKMCR